MTAAIVPGIYRLTFADWLKTPEDGLKREIIDGELYVTPAPTILHQRVSREVHSRILDFLRATRVGEIFYAPVGLVLSDDHVFEPDLLVILDGSRARIEAMAIMGPADVVVEILSPGNAKRDLVDKRAAYERFGVHEYWIVDPIAQTIEVLLLGEQGYARTGLFRRPDVLTSSLLAGLSLPLAEVFPPSSSE